MSNKSLAILGIIAAVMIILAAVLSGVSSGPRKGSGGPAYLVQGLDPTSVGKIVVGTGADEVTLQRRGKAYFVVNKDNYPADVKEINELFKKCLDIKTTGSAHTSNAANHEDLEVTEDKARSVVKFLSTEPNSPMLAGVALGKSLEAGQGTYVRLLPGDSVYVTLESPWIRDGATDYIDQDLITLKLEDVNSVAVRVDGREYTLKQDEGDNVVLENNIPPGKKLKTGDAKSVLKALTDLRFDDVSRSVGGLAFNDQYVCRLNDSTVYTLSIAQKDEKTYAVCKADFTGQRPTKEKKLESEEELKKKEALLLADDKAQQFAARHEGWIYEIADWKAKNLTKKLSDLLEEEEKPKDPNEVKAPEGKTTEAKDPNAVKPIDAKPAEPGDPNALKLDKPAEPEPSDPNTPKAVDPNSAKP
ncbi:MAG: DUF4340 domain-containing protein [Planctomycetes bacterium]|nr:DUF4340 domain-containing protein [Planctomycetota bacterium]